MVAWEKTADIHKADGTYDLNEAWTFFEARRGAKEAMDKDRWERGEDLVRQTEPSEDRMEAQGGCRG